jgi:Mg2+-importing ATPase
VALAAGRTPDLLPMVMTVTLSRGAVRMAERKVVVKRLSAIHDLGAMDVLCTDKTGTLTEVKIFDVGSFGTDGAESSRVTGLARLNSRFASSMRSSLDDAILFEIRAPPQWPCCQAVMIIFSAPVSAAWLNVSYASRILSSVNRA